MSTKDKYSKQEYTWTVIENKVSPYSLCQNNNEYPVPVWTKPLAYLGVTLLVLAVFYQMLQGAQ